MNMQLCTYYTRVKWRTRLPGRPKKTIIHKFIKTVSVSYWQSSPSLSSLCPLSRVAPLAVRISGSRERASSFLAAPGLTEFHSFGEGPSKAETSARCFISSRTRIRLSSGLSGPIEYTKRSSSVDERPEARWAFTANNVLTIEVLSPRHFILGNGFCVFLFSC